MRSEARSAIITVRKRGRSAVASVPVSLTANSAATTG